MNSENQSAQTNSDQTKTIAGFRKDIAIMRKQLCCVQIESRQEKNRREEAVFAKEKLLQLNKRLIEQFRLLKKERKPKNQECKVSSKRKLRSYQMKFFISVRNSD